MKSLKITKAYLQWGEVMIDKESQATYWHYKELHAECVVITIISGLELGIEEVNGAVGS